MRRNLFFFLVESFFIKSCHNKGAPRVNRDIKLTNGNEGGDKNKRMKMKIEFERWNEVYRD